MRARVAYFFIARTALAVGLAAAVFMFVPIVMPRSGSMFWLLVIAGGIVGYIGPSFYIDRRISRAQGEHRSGFPGFHGPAGGVRRLRPEHGGRRSSGSGASSAILSVALRQHPHGQSRDPRRPHHDRGARASRRPARARGGALVRHPDPAVDRARLEHHRCAARLPDDMRHKRLSRAEEKAYSLPAKLAVPMMVCIFPVLFVVILLPVIVRLHMNGYF